MKTEYVPRKTPRLKDSIKLIPECDKDIIKIGRIIQKADPNLSTLNWDDSGHLMYGYTTLEELIRIAASD